jgi:hypothetical protein
MNTEVSFVCLGSEKSTYSVLNLDSDLASATYLTCACQAFLVPMVLWRRAQNPLAWAVDRGLSAAAHVEVPTYLEARPP